MIILRTLLSVYVRIVYEIQEQCMKFTSGVRNLQTVYVIYEQYTCFTQSTVIY